MTITIDRNGDGIIDQQADNLVDIFGGRNDFRFGRGPNGEMFITSKQTSDLFIVTNTVAEGCLLGDVNTDGFVTFLDISPFIGALNSGEFQCEADCDESGEIDFLEAQYRSHAILCWVRLLLPFFLNAHWRFSMLGAK